MPNNHNRPTSEGRINGQDNKPIFRGTGPIRHRTRGSGLTFVKTDCDSTRTSKAGSPCVQQYASRGVPSCRNSASKRDRHGVRRQTLTWRSLLMAMSLFGSPLPTSLLRGGDRADTDFGAAGAICERARRWVVRIAGCTRDPARQGQAWT